MTIISPSDWQTVGRPITVKQLEDALLQAVSDIPCDCLSFSGGIDSSLLLYLMLKLNRNVRTFTATCAPDHPDAHYSRLAIAHLEKAFNTKIASSWEVFEGLSGDGLVRAFYSGLHGRVDSIIAGDGIDELMCGYYGHQLAPTEATYLKYLRWLVPEHLTPLNDSSGKVEVYLPYLDDRITALLWQIPLSSKVDSSHRKKLMLEMSRGKLPQDIIRRRKYGFGTACDKAKETEKVHRGAPVLSQL